MPPVNLRVADLQVGHYVGVYVAQARGYFEEEGLAVTLEPVGGSESVVPALATGQADVAIVGLSAGLLNAIAREVPIRILAGGVRSEGTSEGGGAGVLVRKDLFDIGRYRDYSDLRGLRIGVPGGLGTGLGRDVGVMVIKGGVTMGDVQVISLGAADAPLALANGAIDMAVVNQPYAAAAVNSGVAVRWKSVGEIDPGQQSTVVIASPQFPERQPEAATRFLQAYLRGVRDYNAAYAAGDPVPMYRILADFTPLKDLTLYEELGRTSVHPDGALNLDSMESAQDFWAAQGLIPQRANLRQAVDLEYLEAALQHLDGRGPVPAAAAGHAAP
jgi:NitT/TauT family transport system substrate-binding protein